MDIVFRPNRLTDYSDESILAEVTRVITEHFQGKAPTRKDFDKFSRVEGSTLSNRFGSWGRAVRKAGFEYSDPKEVEFSEAQMIAELERVKGLAAGMYFSRSFFNANCLECNAWRIMRHFKCSWRSLLKNHFSLTPTEKPQLVLRKSNRKRTSDHSDEDLFAELKRVWDEFGRRPSYAEFKLRSKIAVWVFEHRFGTWALAIEWFFAQTGYTTVGLPGSHATPQLLLAELRKIITESRHGDALSYKKYRELGGAYSIGVFQNHFGGWKEAVRLVGGRDGHVAQYSDEELYSEIQRLWENYGRQPTYTEMKKEGAMSCSAFENRFGSWIKAIHAFCGDREARADDIAEGENGTAPGVVTAESQPNIEPVVQPRASVSVPVVFAEVQTNTILVDSRRLPGKRLRFRVLQRDGFRCVMCGRGPSTHPGVILHPDHTIPWSRGGLTVFENLQTACEDCNLGKSDFMPEATKR